MQEPVWSYRRRLKADDSLFPADQTEASHVGRLRDPATALDYLHARDLMRTLLSSSLSVDMESVRLQSHDDAPPLAEGFEKTGISWSRSGPHALAGLMRHGRIGVDVEQVRPREIGGMLGMIATEREQAVVLTLDAEASRLAAFYRLWCTKEAVLKWRGDGLRGNAKHVEVPAEIISGQTERLQVGDLTLQLLRPSEDCLAAIAFSG